MLLKLSVRNIYQIAKPIIILRPVDQADISFKESRFKVRLINNTYIIPHIKFRPSLATRVVEPGLLQPSCPWIRIAEIKESSRPCRFFSWDMFLPEAIIFRFIDEVLTFNIIQCETGGKCLLTLRVGYFRSM